MEFLQIQIPADKTSWTRTRATQMLTNTIVEICSTPLTTAHINPHFEQFHLQWTTLSPKNGMPNGHKMRPKLCKHLSVHQPILHTLFTLHRRYRYGMERHQRTIGQF